MFIMRGSGKNDQVQGPEDSIGKIQGCCNIHNFPSVSLVHLRRRIDLLYVRNRANMSLPKGKTKKTEDYSMKNIYTLRNELDLRNYNTAITRADFEAHFTKTKERIEFTFNGWDGKSYDGESRKAYIYRTDIPGYEEARFIKVGRRLHFIDEESSVLEKATGAFHKTVGWLVDVERA
nr:MAG TPA: hypothetical protein [Caudoviricetes sp.]